MAIGTEQLSSGSRKSDRHVGLASNIIYDEVETEPQVNGRAYIALAAMLLLNFTKTFGLQGPPAVVSSHPANWTRAESSPLECTAIIHWKGFGKP